MIDISRLIEDICEGLDSSKTAPVSTNVEILSTDSLQQVIDFNRLSTVSSVSTLKTEVLTQTQTCIDKNTILITGGSRVSSSYAESVENAESVERELKTPAESTDHLFPLTTKEVERVEREGAACQRSTLDLNHAAPQRGEWLSDATMAALAPQLVPAENLPIQPAEVRAGVERELRALAALGRTGPDALRDAIELIRAKVRNSPLLVEVQLNAGRCFVCQEPNDDSRAVVAVMTGKPGTVFSMHADCHAEHSRRMAERVEAIMAAAGFGANRREESAA